MVFNSLHFALFFAIVYLIYISLGKKWRWQNALLLAASYIFYSFWDWRFLSLIILSTAFNYHLGLMIGRSSDERTRKRLLIIDICLNLGMLGIFKYFNFFAQGLSEFLSLFGCQWLAPTFNIILPLGISFYTFQVLSYPIDIYRKAITPTKNILDFSLFVAFFPLLISGPIERARNMLPQISNERRLVLGPFYEGTWLFFWGLFKKIVIGDNLARLTAIVFSAGLSPNGREVLIGMYALSVQIYADFSGYSDMARGIARVMGFDVMANFRAPFFAPTIQELWQRWHISLTTWIKEYLYYPLALAEFKGRQIAPWLVIIITWAIMGFWHGPYWQFIVWGVYHGVLIVMYSKGRPYLNLVRPRNPFLKGAWAAVQTLVVFSLFSIGILCFAANSMTAVYKYLATIFSNFGPTARFPEAILLMLTFTLSPVIMIDYFQFRKNDDFIIFRWPPWVRAVIYYVLFYMIMLYGNFNAEKYFYFQF